MSNNDFAAFIGELQKLEKNYTIKLKLEDTSQIITQLDSIKSFLESIATPGFNEVFSFTSLITSALSLGLAVSEADKKVETSFKKMLGSITDDANTMDKVFKDLGKYVGEGVSEGLKDSLREIKNATEKLADGIPDAFCNILIIQSPSKRMKKLASYIPDGVIEGIKEGMQEVKKSMSKLTDAVEEPAKGLSKFKFSLGGISAIAGGVGLAIGAFSSFMASNDELRAKMEETFAKVTEAFAPVMDAVMGLFDSFTAGGEGSCSVMDTIASVAASLAEVLSGIIEAISGIFREHGDTIMAVVSTIGEFVSTIAGGLVETFGGAFDLITGIFTGNGEKIKEGFGDIWKGIKKTFSGFADFFNGLWDKIVGVFGKIGARVGDAIGGAFKTIVNSILGFAEETLNKFIKSINGAIKLINGIPGVEIPKLPVLNIPRLATGGLVDPGQFFVAREAGPELVGSFGARTAVMNNNQIVDAVSAGVYKAVKEAMGSGSGSYTFNINNHLDGREIGRQVIKYHNGLVKQYGHSPLII